MSPASRKPKSKPVPKKPVASSQSGKILDPGAYKDSSAKLTPYAVARFEHLVNDRGLTETHCLGCGRLVAAAKDSHVLEFAEIVHRCA